MRPDWKIDFLICTIGYIAEHTGHNHQSESTLRKADGRQRPLGIASLEDKLVQQAVVAILNQIYEVDFTSFSYGFRPGHSPHQALDGLNVGIFRKRVNWVLDANIRRFFDTLRSPMP
jgi:retron-type reverse transcriptase